MEKRINSYTFNPEARTVILNEFVSLDHDAIISIVNTRNGVYLYKAEEAVPKISIAGNTITCFIDLSDHLSTDPLLIYYDDGTYPITIEDATEGDSALSTSTQTDLMLLQMEKLTGIMEKPSYMAAAGSSLVVSGTVAVAGMSGTNTITTVTGLTNIGGVSAATTVTDIQMIALQEQINAWANSIRSILT